MVSSRVILTGIWMQYKPAGLPAPVQVTIAPPIAIRIGRASLAAVQNLLKWTGVMQQQC